MEYVLSDIFFFHFILLAMWWMSRINPVWLDKIYCILQVIGQYLAFISHTPSVFIVQAGKLRIQRLNDCARNYLFMIHQMNVWSTVDCHNYLFYFQWRCDMYALFFASIWNSRDEFTSKHMWCLFAPELSFHFVQRTSITTNCLVFSF